MPVTVIEAPPPGGVLPPTGPHTHHAECMIADTLLHEIVERRSIWLPPGWAIRIETTPDDRGPRVVAYAAIHIARTGHPAFLTSPRILGERFRTAGRDERTIILTAEARHALTGITRLLQHVLTGTGLCAGCQGSGCHACAQTGVDLTSGL